MLDRCIIINEYIVIIFHLAKANFALIHGALIYIPLARKAVLPMSQIWTYGTQRLNSCVNKKMFKKISKIFFPVGPKKVTRSGYRKHNIIFVWPHPVHYHLSRSSSCLYPLHSSLD